MHDRDRGLGAAADHVDVRDVQVGAQVDRWADRRPEGGRGQVDGLHPRLQVPRRVGLVRLGRGGLEHQLRQRILAQQPVKSLGRGGQAEFASPGQPVGLDDPDHVADLDVVAAPQLGQQVGADVARDRRWRPGFSSPCLSSEPRQCPSQAPSQRRLVAIAAPSASAANLAHTTVGCTSGENVAREENPQSALAMTFSRPTSPA